MKCSKMNLILAFIVFCTYYIRDTNAQDDRRIRLNTGKYVPIIGLGTYAAEGTKGVQAVKDALEAGYRHIDTATFYRNEKEVGKAIQESIKDGIVKRSDVFITTKVWPKNMNRKKALASIRKSLNDLNVTYIDLVLLHWPLPSNTDNNDIYKGMEDAFDQKLVRTIGVSNFEPSECNNCLQSLMKSAKIKPAMNQIRIYPGHNQDETIKLCKANNISITAFSPLGTGSVLKDPTLVAIGKKYNKSAAQVAIRWHIQNGVIPIPKSTNKKRIIENFDVFDFKLTNNEIKKINAMDKNKR